MANRISTKPNKNTLASRRRRKKVGKKQKFSNVKSFHKDRAYKSKTEVVVAQSLDKFGAEYEPKKFQITIPCFYVPDFYIRELDLWIEVKGVFDLEGRRKVVAFAEENNLLVVLMLHNRKMVRRVMTNETWLREVEIPYTFATRKGDAKLAHELIKIIEDMIERKRKDGTLTHTMLEELVEQQSNDNP